MASGRPIPYEHGGSIPSTPNVHVSLGFDSRPTL